MLPEVPESELRKDHSPGDEGPFQLMHIKARIVDSVLNQVAFKLTIDSIKALVEYHRDIFCVDAKYRGLDWPEKEQQCKIMHDEFVQDVNKFIFWASTSALELDTGELLHGKSEEVKNAIKMMMKPLSPPKIGEPMQHAPPPPPPPNSPVPITVALAVEKVLQDGKYACPDCIRGHRSSPCRHSGMFSVVIMSRLNLI